MADLLTLGGSALASVPDPTTYVNNQIAAQQQQAQNANVLQNQAIELQNAQRQQAQAVAAQGVLQSYMNNPTPQGLSQIAVVAPQIFDSIAKDHALKTADQQRSDLMGYSALSGQAQIAADSTASKESQAAAGQSVVTMLQQRVDADNAAGRPSDSDAAALAQAQAGNFSGVLAGANIMLRGAMGPDRYADAYNAQTTGSKAPSEIALANAQANEANAAQYKIVKNADGSESVVAVGNAAGTDAGSVGQSSPSGPVTLTGALGYNPPATPTVGVRNNNYGNVKALPKGQTWQGQTGVDANGYAIFDTPADGARAAVMNLQSYGHRGVNTPLAIANRWAPAGDGSNNPGAYAKAISASLGVTPTTPLNLADPTTASHVAAAIFKQENGGENLPPTVPSAAGVQSAAPAAATGGSPGAATGSGARVVYSGQSALSPQLTPAAIDATAQSYLATGDMPALGNGPLAEMNRTAVMNRVADIEASTGKTGADAAQVWADRSAGTTTLSNLSTLQAQVQASEHTVQQNMGIVQSLAPKGAGPTGSPALNAPIQYLRKNVWGSPQVAAYDAAIGTVADEYAKVMSSNTGSGGATSDSARNEAYSRLSNAATLGQVTKIMGTMRMEMANRNASLTDAIQTTRGNMRSGQGPAAGQGTPVQVTSPAQAAALPSGTPFRTPDGRVVVRH